VSLFPGPALVDDLGEVFRDVQRPAVVPAGVEPVGQLPGGVVVGGVHVQFTLALQSGEGQVARPDKGHARRDPARQVKEIQLGVEQEFEEQFDLHLA
jgi:hypothetical protein